MRRLIVGFEEHIPTTLWELSKFKANYHFQIRRTQQWSCTQESTNPLFLLSVRARCSLCAELKCEFLLFLKKGFPGSKLFKSWGHLLSSISLAPLYQLLQLVKEVISIRESHLVLLVSIAWSKNWREKYEWNLIAWSPLVGCLTRFHLNYVFGWCCFYTQYIFFPLAHEEGHYDNYNYILLLFILIEYLLRIIMVRNWPPCCEHCNL